MGVSGGGPDWLCCVCLGIGTASQPAIPLGSQGWNLELGRHTALANPTPWLQLESGLKLAWWLWRQQERQPGTWPRVSIQR